MKSIWSNYYTAPTYLCDLHTLSKTVKRRRIFVPNLIQLASTILKQCLQKKRRSCVRMYKTF